MEKKEMLYEGKAKKVYTTEDPDVLIVSYRGPLWAREPSTTV